MRRNAAAVMCIRENLYGSHRDQITKLSTGSSAVTAVAVHALGSSQASDSPTSACGIRRQRRAPLRATSYCLCCPHTLPARQLVSQFFLDNKLGKYSAPAASRSLPRHSPVSARRALFSMVFTASSTRRSARSARSSCPCARAVAPPHRVVRNPDGPNGHSRLRCARTSCDAGRSWLKRAIGEPGQ